jgi:hypothetical protein
MNAVDSADLAAHLALNSQFLIRKHHLISECALAEYWEASRDRQSTWWRIMSDWRRSLRSVADAIQRFDEIKPIIDEMLISELLTRVWSAIADVHDQAFREPTYQPIARNILIAHVDVRNRVWAMLFNELSLPAEILKNIALQRRRVERWTDLLLAHLPNPDAVATWAIDAERMSDFRDDLVDERRALPNSAASELLIGSLQAALREDANCQGGATAATSALNRRIDAALCSAVEPFRSEEELNQTESVSRRMDQQADQCQRLLSDLLTLDAVSG